MLRKSKMELAPINRAINILDPPKDAIVDWKVDDKAVRLSPVTHGPFMKRDVCAFLFNPTNAELPSDVAHAPGVGYNKTILKKMILTAERLGVINTNKQELVRLSRSASGSDDARLKGVFLAHDAGPRLQDIASSYKAVLTPGAILDRAPRDMNFKDKVVLLHEASTFSPDLLKELDMNHTIQSLVFNGKVGPKYRFTIKTSIPGYEEKAIDYTSTFQPDSSEARACSNKTKNEYIYDHYTEESKLSYIRFLVLLKELGDTLQVLWLKQFIGSHDLTGDKTAIVTNDTILWLRSLVNGVSCIFTEKKGTLTTFYPILANEEQIQVANLFMKEQLLNTLEQTNKSVVKSIGNCINLISGGSVFGNLTIKEEYSPSVLFALIRVLKSMYVAVKEKATDILKEVRTIQAGDMDEYREIIASRMMKKQPFYAIKRDSLRFCAEYKEFLPNGPAKLSVRLNYLQTLCSQPNPTEKVMSEILGDIPLLSQEQVDAVDLTQQGGNTLSGGIHFTKPAFTRILNQNSHIPGFFTSFLMTHMPEIFYMGFAYDVAFGKKHIHAVYSKLLNVDPADAYFSHLLELNLDLYMEVDTEALVKNRAHAVAQDKLTRDLCATVSKASVHSGREGGTLFDVMGEEVLWLLEWCNRNHMFTTESAKRYTAHMPARVPELHWKAIRLYDVLYNNEVNLCIRNQRSKQIDFGHLIKGALDEMKAAELSDMEVEVRSPIPARVERLVSGTRKRAKRKSRSKSGNSLSTRSQRTVRTPTRTKRKKRSGSAVHSQVPK